MYGVVTADRDSATLKKYYSLFIIVTDYSCQGHVAETEQMVVDYCNENKLKIKKGLEHLQEEFQKKLKYKYKA